MTIRRALPALALSLAVTALPAFAQDAAKPADPNVAKARAAIKGLADGLKEQLVTALKSGGPVAALNVCRTAAPGIASERSKEHGVKIGRTALKVRNPDNAPDAFERKVLEQFVEKLKAGADVATLDHAEVVETGGVKVFRYMKAIPTASEPCLACHGGEIKPEVAAEIAKLYPKDAAVGFKAGELRGAFTVSETLK